MMVTAYGLACLIVVLLGLVDRRSLPYAVILSSGWLAGFLPVEVWWFISVAELSAMTAFIHRATPWQFKAIAVCVLPMLLLDAYYWLMDWLLGVYVGVEYASGLNTLLTIQLFLCGMTGGWRVGRIAILWSRGLFDAGLSRVRGLAGKGPTPQPSRTAR